MLQKLLFAFCTRAERPMSVNLHREASFVPITLNTLWDNPGARRWPKRLGRGSASGKGNSCGKGMRGQNSRSGGGVPNKFEGGQSPLAKRLPKWGAKPLQNNHREVNLCQVIDRVLQGRIDATKVITIKDLWEANIFKKTRFGVKLLARGANRLAELPTPLRFEVSDASKIAIDAIRAAGGEVTCIYRTPLLVHEHLYPEKYELELRDPLPCSRTVHRLQRIEDKGVEVVYQKPRWVLEQQAKQATEEVLKKAEVKEAVASEVVQKEKKQKKKKNQEEVVVEVVDMSNFKYPASREPGVGDNKIRKRKPEIYKQINLGLD